MAEERENLTIEEGIVKTKTHECSVNLHMVPGKVAYFSKMAMLDKLNLSILFYISVGLNPAEAGLVNGLQNIGGMIGAPLWALIADKLRLYKVVATFVCAMTVLMTCMQPFISLVYGDKIKNTCPLKSNQTLITLNSHKLIENRPLFYTLLVTATVSSSFEFSTMSFVDSGVIQRIESTSKGSSYGNQRLFGALGSAVGSIVDAAAIKYFPHIKISCYSGIFIVYATFGTLLGISCYFLFNGITVKHEGHKSEEHVAELLQSTLKSYDTIFFLTAVLFNGCMQSILISFTYLYLKELHAPTLLFGVAMSVGGASGVVIYSVTHKIMDVIGEPMNAMCISWFFLAVRVTIVAFLLNPYYVLFAEALQGLTYSLFWVASIEHIKIISKPAIITTMCGIMNSLFNPFSFLIANVIGGKVYGLFGGKKLFISTAVVCLFWSIITLIYNLVKKRKRNGYMVIK